MASVIRVKRRIDEDPAEALVLSRKRQRQSDLPAETEEQADVLSFAGTITSKHEPVSRHIREAIKRRKLLPLTADFKHTFHIPEQTSKLRKQTEKASRNNRYRVTWSRRALDLDLLDKEDHNDDVNTDADSPSSENPETELSLQSRTDEIPENKENVALSTPANHTDDVDTEPVRKSAKISKDSSLKHNSKSTNSAVLAASNDSNHSESSNTRSQVRDDKMFCIFDVENEGEDELLQEVNQQSTCGITMNNVPMVSTRVGTPPVDESQFVYDLYYTHSNLSDLDLQAVLTVEALCDEFVNDQHDGSQERDFVYDESDDSNDENNWRNDYPDEDPRFFENEEEEYGYAEDMLDTNFLNDDDGDLLAYWMNTRCRVDGESDAGEDEYEDDKGKSCGSSSEDELGWS